MWTYAFLFSSLMVDGDTLLPHRASVMSSTRRTDTPARYISMRASSTLLSRRRYRSMMAVSKEPLEFWHPQDNIPGSGGKVSAIVAVAVALAVFIALVPGCLGQFFSFGLQQFIERLLHAISYQLLQLPLYYFLV